MIGCLLGFKPAVSTSKNINREKSDILEYGMAEGVTQLWSGCSASVNRCVTPPGRERSSPVVVGLKNAFDVSLSPSALCARTPKERPGDKLQRQAEDRRGQT